MSGNVQPSENLKPEQVQAIAALLSQPTIEKAARAVGISSKQLTRWMHEDAAFQAALNQAGTAMIDQITRRLMVAADLSLDTLENVQKNKRVAPGVKVRAASVIMDNLSRLKQLNDLEQRLARLEGQSNVEFK